MIEKIIKVSYREIKIGKKERLLIDLDDKRYEMLSTFLESDVTPFEEWIKEDFDKVLSGQSEYEEVNGNVCGVEIRPIKTKVFDNLAEDGMGDWCEIDTKELRYLIDEWCEKVHEFKTKYY